jgi:phosphocarrier protein
MQTKTLTVSNALGLHARPSAKIANLANRFSCSLQLSTEHKTIDAKSIMQLMMLAANKGTCITLTADGNDENEAIAAITELFENRFDEKE